MNVTVQIFGGDNVLKKIMEMRSASKDAIEKAVMREAINLIRYIKEQKLNGGVLNVRTGRLRRSITAQFEGQGTGTFTAKVGTNVKYGRYWELGFSRKVGAGARGGARTLKGSALEKYMAKHPAGTKNYAARPFIKSSFEENLPRIKENLAKVVKEVVTWS